MHPRSMTYEAMCRGKHRHRSLGAAEAHIRSLVKTQGTANTRRPYVCFYCKGWHIGRRRNS